MRSTSEKDREDLVTRSSTEKQNIKKESVCQYLATVNKSVKQIIIIILKNEYFLKSTENKPRQETQR